MEFGAAGIDPTADDPMKTMALPKGRFTLPGRVLVQSALTIGRDPSCDLYLDGPRDHIAREHAEITFVLGEFHLKAQGALATYVNGERTVHARLQDGDAINIAHYTVQVNLVGLSCDLVVSENSPGLAVEHFASAHDSADPYRTMYRVAMPEPVESADNFPDEGPAQRHRPVWVPPLETRRDRRTLAVVALGILLGLGVAAYFTWPSGSGFLNKPISTVHNSDAFNQAAMKTLGAEASCASCHAAFAGKATGTCTQCHTANAQGVHHSAKVDCTGCHVEHPTGPVGPALVVQARCIDCHKDRHAKLIQWATAPVGTKSSAPLALIRPKMKTDALHRIHVGITGQCAGCHADTQRKAPIPAQQSCLRCHGEPATLATLDCSTCHGEHQAAPITALAAAPPPKPSAQSTGPLTPKSKNHALLWAILALLPIFALVGLRRRRAVDHGMDAYRPVEKTKLKKLIHILEDACVGCAECVVACPFDVLDLVQLKAGKVVARVINFDSCRECGDCEAVCKPLALTRRYPGEPLPMVSRPDLDPFYMTNVPGMYLIGEAAGKALVRNANNLGARTIQHIIHSGITPGSAQAAGLDLDVAIVGSGPGGLSAGVAAQNAGLAHVVLEKGSDFAQTIRGYPKGKPVQNQPATTTDIGALPVADTNREKLLDMWSSALAKTPINAVYNAEVSSIESLGDDDAGFRVTTTKGVYTASRVILSTGTRGSPRKLRGVPGNDLEKIRYQLVDPDVHQGEHVAIVGGGNSALEAAIAIAETQGNPNTVRLVYRKDSFARASQKNIDTLTALSESGRITLHLNSNPVEVTPESITIEDNQGQSVTVDNHYIYCMLGAEPPTKWLNRIGITFSDKPQGWSPAPSDDLGFLDG